MSDSISITIIERQHEDTEHKIRETKVSEKKDVSEYISNEKNKIKIQQTHNDQRSSSCNPAWYSVEERRVRDRKNQAKNDKTQWSSKN